MTPSRTHSRNTLYTISTWAVKYFHPPGGWQNGVYVCVYTYTSSISLCTNPNVWSAFRVALMSLRAYLVVGVTHRFWEEKNFTPICLPPTPPPSTPPKLHTFLPLSRLSRFCTLPRHLLFPSFFFLSFCLFFPLFFFFYFEGVYRISVRNVEFTRCCGTRNSRESLGRP